MENIVFNEDCMIGMKHYPDGYFDLAIVDPPYGINIGTEINRDNFKEGTSKNSMTKFENQMKDKAWDAAIPNEKYWKELFRVSKNQIIWGGNYFLEYLGATRCLIVWDKMTYIPTMAQIEIAWTSFKKHSKLIKINSNQLDRIHPTQKPKQLYRWILQNYAQPNDKILDTHVGSGSSRIACMQDGFDFTGFEIDKDYFDAQEKRFANYKAQLRLW